MLVPPSYLRWLPLALIALGGWWLRTHDLARRPMHADEANQAVKLGELLETGRYAFDPRDHHGPTLYYAAVPIAWLRGQHSLATLTETTVRLVSALFGTAAIVLLGLLAAPLGRAPALVAAVFFALSPPAVYYSRYFIQETLLLTFTLGVLVCAQAWWRTRLTRWSIGAGVCAGLMQATKATAPLFLVAALLAALATHFVAERGSISPTATNAKRARVPLLAFVIAAFFTAALLYTSFGTNLGGAHDALRAYIHAAHRFGADAPLTGHEKPWWYYLWLFGWHRAGGLLWQQIGFAALALAGAIVVWVSGSRSDRRYLRGVTVYSVLIIGAFSAFAYKTPWQVVHFVPPMAMLAAAALAAITQLRTGKLVAIPAGILVGAALFQQTWRAAFQRPADARNPFAYVHSSADVLKFRPAAEAALAAAPNQPIRVISEEYWPLPWYFRGLPQVGYWSTPPDDCDGALVIASGAQADTVRRRLRGKYHESLLGLRPGVILTVFTREP